MKYTCVGLLGAARTATVIYCKATEGMNNIVQKDISSFTVSL